jgi:hypothetical protein
MRRQVSARHLQLLRNGHYVTGTSEIIFQFRFHSTEFIGISADSETEYCLAGRSIEGRCACSRYRPTLHSFFRP